MSLSSDPSRSSVKIIPIESKSDNLVNDLKITDESLGSSKKSDNSETKLIKKIELKDSIPIESKSDNPKKEERSKENKTLKSIECDFRGITEHDFRGITEINIRDRLELLKLVRYSAWIGHEGFVWWLSETYKPNVTVDLGVDWGYSTFAFALAKQGITYGIDWFQGDPHAGTKNTYDEVMRISKILEEKHKCKIAIIKGDFLEVAKEWKSPIDLLHLDGFHSYDQCKVDWNAWFPHLAKDGIALMHDTVSYKTTVGKLFNEIPLFKCNFTHSYGLGVLSRNRSIIAAICARYDLELTEIPISSDEKENKICTISKALYGGVDVTSFVKSLGFPLKLAANGPLTYRPTQLFNMDPTPGVPKSLKIWYGPNDEEHTSYTINEYDNLWLHDFELTGKCLDHKSINKSRKVIDCFMFYNELEMLNLRLHELDTVVDRFVLVESGETFVGKEKELYFENNKDKFKKFLHKIEHIIVERKDFKTAFDREHYHRNAISQGLAKIDIKDHDLVIISDLDEIPDPKIISNFKAFGLSESFAFNQRLFYYNLECEFLDKWVGSIISSWNLIKNFKPNDLRHLRINFRKINGGWHLSYFGDIKQIINKLKNFSHTEFSEGKFVDPEYIMSCIKSNKGLFPHSSITKLNNPDADPDLPQYKNLLNVENIKSSKLYIK